MKTLVILSDRLGGGEDCEAYQWLIEIDETALPALIEIADTVRAIPQGLGLRLARFTIPVGIRATALDYNLEEETVENLYGLFRGEREYVKVTTKKHTFQGR